MSTYVWGDSETQFFFHLVPEVVLDAIDSLGFRTTGRCLTLNSMENRVYEVEIERESHEIKTPSDKFVIAKFYRPGRWTKTQILEEHQFLYDLHDVEIPVIVPIKFEGESLFKLQGHELWYAIFPKKGGRVPDEMNEIQLGIMGRLLARIHNVGASKQANHRLSITPESFGKKNLEFLLDKDIIPAQYRDNYQYLVEQICHIITPFFEGISTQRIHGDCHCGNIIWREDEGPSVIDFDDMLTGPPIQDIWLVNPGVDQHAMRNREILLEAYDSMRSLDHKTLRLIEPLRTLRFIHFSAWVAKRWQDPAFKHFFPNFGSDQYWESQMNDLRNQLSLIVA